MAQAQEEGGGEGEGEGAEEAEEFDMEHAFDMQEADELRERLLELQQALETASRAEPGWRKQTTRDSQGAGSAPYEGMPVWNASALV